MRKGPTGQLHCAVQLSLADLRALNLIYFMETLTLSIYRSCSELSIFLFHNILETGDYTLLLKEPVETEDPEEQDYIEKELNEAWNEVYEEYCKLAEDNASLMYFLICNELLYLKTRRRFGTVLLNSLIRRRDSASMMDYIDELARWKFVIDKEKPFEAEVAKVKRLLRAAKNKIRLKEDELEKYKENDGEEKMSLVQQVLKVELALGKNEIDPKTTSVERWIAMIKEISLKNEAMRKIRRR